jgi:hypothetical protein
LSPLEARQIADAAIAALVDADHVAARAAAALAVVRRERLHRAAGHASYASYLRAHNLAGFGELIVEIEKASAT